MTQESRRSIFFGFFAIATCAMVPLGATYAKDEEREDSRKRRKKDENDRGIARPAAACWWVARFTVDDAESSFFSTAISRIDVSWRVIRAATQHRRWVL